MLAERTAEESCEPMSPPLRRLPWQPPLSWGFRFGKLGLREPPKKTTSSARGPQPNPDLSFERHVVIRPHPAPQPHLTDLKLDGF